MTRRWTWFGSDGARGRPGMRGRVCHRVGVTAIVVLGFATVSSAATAGWTGLPLPTGRALTFYRVSCASPSACFALGASQPDGFVRYQGTHVTRLKRPRLGRSASLDALACSSATACVAIGMSGRSSNHGVLALRWSNGRWSEMSLPAGPGRSLKVSAYQLTGLACPSTGTCVAVGQVSGVTTKPHAVIRPLLLRWNGQQWSSVRSPLTAGTLRSVSCASATACTAVGAGTEGPAVLRLHAGRWTRVRLGPRVSRAVGSSLASISCPTAISCLATGLINTAHRSAPAVTRVVVLRQTSGGWSTEVPPLPTLAPGDHPDHLTDDLTDVSCGAPGRCLGVGTFVNEGLIGSGRQGGMSLVFTATSRRPVPKTRAGVPASVSCPTAAFCLVGGYRSISRYTP